MTNRRAAAMVTMVMACGPDRISHGDGGGTGSSGDPSGTDDGGSGGADASTGDAPAPTIPGEGPYGAGTRLKPVIERTEDGVTQLVHWYDGELGIDCEFVRDSVGTPRCLPLDVEGVTVGFASEDCTEPVLGALACAEAPTRVRGQVPGAAQCSEGTRHQAYLRGAPIGSGDVGVFSGLQGECRGDLHPERYALTPIADEEFVAAAVVVETRGSVLVRALVADDGAFLRERLVDPRTGTACLLGPSFVSADEAWVCRLPESLPRGFADDACSEALVAVPDDGTCDPPAVWALEGATRWLAIGEAWEGPMFAVGAGDTCEPLVPRTLDPYSYRRLGDEITAIESPRFERVVADDPGRVRRRGIAGDGEVLVLPGATGSGERWFDAVLDQACEPATDDDGTLRCFPAPFVSPMGELRDWGDAECSETPLLEGRASDPGFTHITRMEAEGCGRIRVESLQNVVGPWDGPVYRRSEEGTCELQDDTDGDTFYQLGNYAQLNDAPVLEMVSEG